MLEIQFRKDELSAREMQLTINLADTAVALPSIIEFIMLRATTQIDAADLWHLPVSTLYRVFRRAEACAEAATKVAVHEYQREFAPADDDDVLDKAANEGLEM